MPGQIAWGGMERVTFPLGIGPKPVMRRQRVHRRCCSNLFAITFGVMFTSVASAQLLPGLRGRLILDEEVSRQIRQTAILHLDDWAAWNGTGLPGRAPAGR